jgi:hypothetical protein
MAIGTMASPGWYADPSGQHERRYWDGATWTTSVSDHGRTTTEPSVPPPTGYRVVAVSRARIAALLVAQLAIVSAFFFEIVASVYLESQVNGSIVAAPSRSTFEWSAWLYHYGAARVVYGYPPLGVWLSLLVAMIVTGLLTLSPVQALKKAGARARWQWSAPAERQRLAQGLRELGCAKTVLRARGRRGLLVVAEIASLALIGFALYTLTSKRGLFLESQTYTRTLTVGVGPVVCLIAGIVAAVACVAAWPRRAEREIAVLPDGTIRADVPAPTPPPSRQV